MSNSFPIFSLAKELNIESNKIIKACNALGINAKGSTKRLSKEELEKVKIYFEKGRNASQEVIDLNNSKVKPKINTPKTKENTKIAYFSNRLIRKS